MTRTNPVWPPGAGEMAERIRAHDWAATPLGPVETWPERFRAVVELVLESPLVSSLVCGPERVLLYNDAAARLYGARHPVALGRPLPDIFPEGWQAVGAALYARVFAGETVQVSAQPLDLRGEEGRAPDVFDATLTPVRDEGGAVVAAHMVGFEVGARLAAEAALRESEQRYRTLFETVDEGFVVGELIRDRGGRGTDFRYLELNPAVERLVGWNAKETVGRLMSEMIPRAETAYWVEGFEATIAAGASSEFEHHHESLGQWYRANVTPIGGDRVALVYQNVTAQKRAELSLRESEERQVFLLRLSDALRAEPTADAVATRAIGMLSEQMGLDRCYIATYHLADDAGEITHQVGNDRVPPMPREIRLSDFPEAFQVASNGTLVIDDVAETEGLSDTDRRNIDALGLRALVAASLRRGENHPVWAIVAVSARPRRWTPGELALAEEATERTWAAMERARAEERLRESEARFRIIVESARDYAIFVTDPERRVTSWPPGAESVFGWTAEEIVGERADILWTPEDREAGQPEREAAQAIDAGFAPDIRWHLRKDGGRVFLEGSVRPLRGPEGQLHGLVKVAQDVTERHRTQGALRESEERFRAAFEQAAVGIVQASLDAHILLPNPGFCQIIGYDAEEAKQLTVRDITHPDDYDLDMAQAARVLAGEIGGYTIEKRYIRKDGAVVWVQMASSLVRDAAGEPSYALAVVQDITDRKHAETAQRESEDRFRQFGEASSDVLWIRSAETLRWEYLSPAFETIYGLSVADALAGDTMRNWTDLIVEEDREQAVTNIGRVRAGERVTFEYRIRRPSDGAVRWLRNTDFPMRDEAGQVVRIGGVGQDVTGLKRIEAALQDSEGRLRTLMEGIPQLVWRSCEKGWWTWSSPQWLAFTGQTQEESHGEGWLDAVQPADREATMRAWEAARSQGRVDAEYRVRRASDGAYLWHHTRSVPVRDEAGRIVEWLGTSTDVQQLKELQEQQAVMVAELQHRTRNLIAVVRSIAGQTMAQTGPTEAFRAEFDHRLEALARVQGLLSRAEEEPVTIESLIRMELDALGALNGAGAHIVLRGPSVRLRHSIVQTLALALHELATNARKHGALSRDDGHLSVTWRVVEADGEGRRLDLEWREAGAEVAADTAPERRGYGRELIERALPYALGARTAYELTPEGVRCTIDLPLEKRERRSRRPR